jgi:hydroxymethylglutaryl-CoA lyase
MTGVRLYEVALRDGLQNESVIVDLDAKLAIVGALVDAGFTDVEVTSFVRARLIPQLADAAELVRSLPDAPNVRFWALVPNQVGLDRALDAGVRHVATVLSASETHNRKNVNRTVGESLAAMRSIIKSSVEAGIVVRSYISTVFGCPYEGPVAFDATWALCDALLDAGASEISLGDTIGVANPVQVQDFVARLVARGVPVERLAGHFHDTRGTALANVFAAYEAGVRVFDGAVGGVGGCPYAPGAAGNVASEDLAHLFASMGVETGVDLDATCEASLRMRAAIGRELPSRFLEFWRTRQPNLVARSA